MLDEATRNLFIAEINRILLENSQDRLISAMRYVFLASTKHIHPFLVIASSSVFNIEVKNNSSSSGN